MLLNLKSLFVILCLIGFTYVVARRWMQDVLLPANTLRDVALGWAGISCFLFLTPNFWLFLLCSLGVMFWLGRRQHPAVLFCGLLYAAPCLEQVIPGFGSINALAAPSYHRILALSALTVWIMSKRNAKSTTPFPSMFFDKMLLGYGALLLILQIKDGSTTNAIRFGLYYYTDAILVFYIGSRFCMEREELRPAAGSLIFGTMVVSLIGIFETGKSWLLYGNITNTLGLTGLDIASYVTRGGSGLLRAVATAGHSIVLGYVVQVGIILWLGLAETKSATSTKKALFLGIGLMACGSLSSLSRGPWVGLLVGLLVWFALSPQGLRRLLQFFGVAAASLGFALLTPAQDEIIGLIPWVGEAEAATIDYRQRLIAVSWFLIKESPWFGSTTFMSAPIMQQMIQGQGIIDLVNTYVALALSAGLVGATFFVATMFGPLAIGIPVYLKTKAKDDAQGTAVSQTTAPLLRAILCALLSTGITIGTVSSINLIPWIYWLLCGLAVGLIQRHKIALTRGSSTG